MKQDKSYFIQSYLIVVLSVAALIGFKQVLPEKIFTQTTGNIKNVAVDSLMLEAMNDTVTDSGNDTLANASRISFKATKA